MQTTDQQYEDKGDMMYVVRIIITSLLAKDRGYVFGSVGLSAVCF